MLDVFVVQENVSLTRPSIIDDNKNNKLFKKMIKEIEGPVK